MATIFPIVEGHGDEIAVPILLRRLAYEELNFSTFTCLRPYRLPRSKLFVQNELSRALELGRLRLRDVEEERLILILMDSDGECIRTLLDTLAEQHHEKMQQIPISMVFAAREYEAWFIAANMSEHDHADLRVETPVHADPEQFSDAKGVFEREFLKPGRSYSETADQPKFTGTMSLQIARRSRSFDKLARELDKARGGPTAN